MLFVEDHQTSAHGFSLPGNGRSHKLQTRLVDISKTKRVKYTNYEDAASGNSCLFVSPSSQPLLPWLFICQYFSPSLLPHSKPPPPNQGATKKPTSPSILSQQLHRNCTCPLDWKRRLFIIRAGFWNQTITQVKQHLHIWLLLFQDLPWFLWSCLKMSNEPC